MHLYHNFWCIHARQCTALEHSQTHSRPILLLFCNTSSSAFRLFSAISSLALISSSLCLVTRNKSACTSNSSRETSSNLVKAPCNSARTLCSISPIGEDLAISLIYLINHLIFRRSKHFSFKI